MQGEKGLKQALKRFHHFRELLLTQCGQSEIKWAKNNWKSKFAPAGWQQRVFDVCWRHSWTCNCQCMSWNCITIVSQKVEGGQKEFVGVRWYNKYNIPPFTVTVCCFGVLVTLKSRAIGLFTFAKYGRCSCSFSKACAELYYVVLSCFIGKLLPFVMCFCCAGCTSCRLALRGSCFGAYLQRGTSGFRTYCPVSLEKIKWNTARLYQFQEIFVLAWQMGLQFSKVWIWGWLHELHLSHNDLDAQVPLSAAVYPSIFRLRYLYLKSNPPSVHPSSSYGTKLGINFPGKDCLRVVKLAGCFMLYWILLTCFINMSIMDLRFSGQVWPFPNTHQASAAIIEAAVHAKDASKKIYPRKVGKGNSAPLWVPCFVDIGKAVEFSKDVPCWCFTDTPWKSSFIYSKISAHFGHVLSWLSCELPNSGALGAELYWYTCFFCHPRCQVWRLWSRNLLRCAQQMVYTSVVTRREVWDVKCLSSATLIHFQVHTPQL